MTDPKDINPIPPLETFPFPLEWIKSSPQKVEEALARMSIPEQVRCVQALRGKEQMDVLILSRQAEQVARLLPEEDVYFLVKDIGEEDALPLLAIASEKQLQFIFDMEWWGGDKFLPHKAMDWLLWVEKANDRQLYDWVLTEDFDQKVMVLQSLIKVFKQDEMTDQYNGVEGLEHFTLDGVFDIFLKVPEAQPLLQNLFKQLYSEEQKVFNALMEAVIWYPVTPTVETSYRWWRSRVEEKGIIPQEEALGVYSLLDADALKLNASSPDNFVDADSPYTVAPVHPLSETDPSTFFGQCLAMMKNHERVNAICWELMYLGNKVMVADRRNFGDLDSHHDTMRKVLGYINIGLELGAGGDIAKGESLLKQTWMQSLFQVGYAGIMRLKWEGEKLIRENGLLLEYLLSPGYMDHLAAAVDRFPKIGVMMEGPEEAETNVQWRNLASLQDIQVLENFVNLARFYVRFARQSLDLSQEKIEQFLEEARFPAGKEDMDIIALTLTALARFTLFKKIECDPLLPEGGRSFLQTIFHLGIFQDESKVVNEDLMKAFREKLLTTSPLAWTPSDQERLDHLLQECVHLLQAQFGRMDPSKKIEWQFTRGLLLK